MSRYENPQVPHEVNVSEESDVKTFFRLSLGIAGIVVVGFIFIFVLFRWFAEYIPFRYEQSLSAHFFSEEESLEKKQQDAQNDLQILADKLASKANLPEEMSIKIHLSDEIEKNAFATFGGHIILTQGLIDSVKSENELAMVIGHEIGHVKHRDVIVTTGSVFTFRLMASVLLGGDVGNIEQASTMLTQLSFSRLQESKADDLALGVLKEYYGHTSGAEGFFTTVLDEQNQQNNLTGEFLSSHPDTEKRLVKIYQTQDKQQPLSPLAKSIVAIQSKPNSKREPDGIK